MRCCYHKNSKTWDNQDIYHNFPLNRLVYNAVMHPNDADEIANSVDPDQTAHLEQSDLVLTCLLSPDCPNI